MMELLAITGIALCVNSLKCQSSCLPLYLIRKAAAKEGWDGGKGEQLKKGGLRQETQGCWHVLFFYYVISIPMHLVLIFNEALAQHPPLSQSYPFPSRSPLSPFLFFPPLTALSPTSIGLLSCILHTFALEHLSCLVEPLYLCHSS